MQIRQYARHRISGFFRYPIYPFLLAIYVPVWLLSNNQGLFDASHLLRPIAVSIGVVFAAYAAFHAYYRDAHKAALVTAAGVVCFYAFSFLREILPIASAGTGALVILGLVFVGVALAVRRTQRIGRTATALLNGFLAAMLILPTLKLAALDVGSPASARSTALRLAPAAAGKMPNIVHIVLDGYSRADVLRALYGFDNTAFIDALRAQGFVVPERATAAYGQTLLSLNATFGLDYINDRVAALGAAHSDKDMRRILTGDLQQSSVLRSLRSAGYQFIAIEGLYNGARLSEADHILSETSDRAGISYFEKELLRLTPVHRMLVRFAMHDETYMQVRFALSNHDYSGFRPPFFVYNHILAPHPPFNIAADGQVRTTDSSMGDGSDRSDVDPQWYEDYRAGYVTKLRFTNKAMLEKLRHLKATVPDPKIIVVHSDHGGGMLLDTTRADRTCFKERMSAFLAVYASDPAVTTDFPDRINLVNLYRILLHRAFGAAIPPLPAHSYFSPWAAPTALKEVADADLESFGPNCVRPGGPAAAMQEASPPSIK